MGKEEDDKGRVAAVTGKRADDTEQGGVVEAHSPVDHPRHYCSHPSGIECITITKHMNFCLGNATKYIWRAGLKGESLEDLEKAKWYIQCEIDRIKEGK